MQSNDPFVQELYDELEKRVVHLEQIDGFVKRMTGKDFIFPTTIIVLILAFFLAIAI